MLLLKLKSFQCNSVKISKQHKETENVDGDLKS